MFYKTEEQAAKHRERQRRYAERNREAIRERRRAWRADNAQAIREYQANWNLAKHYGLTLDQYEEMHSAQQGLCAICLKPETNVVKGTLSRLRVDHNHSTGVVRQLLCNTCNLRLGRLLEDADWTEKAMEYLMKHNLLDNDGQPKSLVQA